MIMLMPNKTPEIAIDIKVLAKLFVEAYSFDIVTWTIVSK